MNFRSLILIIFVSAILTAQAQEKREEYGSEHRFIFHAVLEGLYADGVQNDVLNAMLGNRRHENFVYSCPVCMPVYQALELYRSRPKLAGNKRGKDTFGSGLPNNIREKLLADDPEIRRRAIKELVSLYISRRIEMCNLSETEQKDLQQSFEKMSKRGTRILKQFITDWQAVKAQIPLMKKTLKEAGFTENQIVYAVQGLEQASLGRHYEGWDFCPSCDGSTEMLSK